MSHKLRDISLYYPDTNDLEVLKKFNGKSHVVSDLYVHFLAGYKPPRTSRVSVTLGDYSEVKMMGYTGSILCLCYPFDSKKYWDLHDSDQNRFILDTTHEVALACCKEFGWTDRVFEDAYHQVLEQNFIYEIELKRKLSPNRQYQACLVIDKNERFATISAAFYDKEGIRINKVELATTHLHEMFYNGVIKHHKWFGDQFGIYDLDGEVQVLASSDSSDRTIKFSANKHSQKRLEKFVHLLTYREVNSPAEFEAWLKE